MQLLKMSGCMSQVNLPSTNDAAGLDCLQWIGKPGFVRFNIGQERGPFCECAQYITQSSLYMLAMPMTLLNIELLHAEHEELNQHAQV